MKSRLLEILAQNHNHHFFHKCLSPGSLGEMFVVFIKDKLDSILIYSLAYLGNKRPLVESDLWKLSRQNQTETVVQIFLKNWNSETERFN